ncbi:MAG: MarR family transcriptional regulator [Erythrobacter sp.]
MKQADFSYSSASSSSSEAVAPIRAHVFHQNTFGRAQVAEDLHNAGYQVGFEADVDVLFAQGVEDLGDIIVLDCAGVDAQQLAGLARYDMLLARSSVQLVVTTSIDNLDDVFACFDQTNPQILVDPSRAERMVAVARQVNAIGGSSVREMTDEERVRMTRLSEQVDALAQRMDGGGSAPIYFSDTGANAGDNAHIADAASDAPLALPSPRFIRQIIRQRQARARFFDAHLFGDPAWDMLLDLSAAHGERHPVSVTSLCIASGVPATTALRWVKQMVETGLFERTEDTCDKRRAFIGLSEKAAAAMARYFAEFRAETSPA